MCDFSHLKMSKHFTLKVQMEMQLTMANLFLRFPLKFIAYLASHCRTKPHYFPTKVTIETDWRNSFYEKEGPASFELRRHHQSKLATQFSKEVHA